MSAIGPLLSSRVVQLWGLLAATEARRSAVGFAGLWGTCAAVYAVSPVCFALAQPSPQARRLLLPPLPLARPEAPAPPAASSTRLLAAPQPRPAPPRTR